MINEELKEKISSYISGELTESESLEVKDLIESSEEIRVFYEQNKSMWRMLDDLEPVDPDPRYISNFWNKVEKDNNKFSIFNLFNLNKKWAFAGSFGVFLIVGTFVINSYISINGEGPFVNNFDDETLLTNLDESINPRTPESLDVYGPWDDLEN